MAAAWLIAVVVWPLHVIAQARSGGAIGAGTRAASGAPPPGVGPGAVWVRVVAAPYRLWAGMWELLSHGQVAGAVVAVAPVAVPAGIAAGGLGWAYRRFRMRSGAAGLTPAAPAAFDQRQWRHQVRSARAAIAARGALPLLTASGQVVVGATIRSVRHRTGRTAAIPYPRLRSHQVVIGSTGTGKTTLLLRLWAGFMAAALRRHAAGTGRRPLLVVLDCKGGASSRKVADRTRRVLRDAGARSTAIWPDETPLSLWTLPPDRLVTTLLDLIEHGTGGAAYYSDVMEALVSLAVCAPCGPPASSADFLSRLDPDWLATVYGASGDSAGVATVRSAAKAFNDVKLRFAALWRRLGRGLDGCASYDDADAWYCVLEGTAEVAVAEAQARALTDLLAYYALSGEREILLCVDEFSAVAGGCRSGSSTSGPGRSGWRSRCPRSRGKGWPAPRMNGTGSRPPPRAGSGCCARPGRTRWWPWREPSLRWTPRGGSRGRARGRMTGCHGSGSRRCSTGTSCGGSMSARSPTSTAAG